MEAMYYTFDGDEGLDYTPVWTTHPGWLAIALQARDFARLCGLRDISPQTMERWLRMWALVYFLDDLIDDTPREHRDEAKEVFRHLLCSCQGKRQLPEWVNPDLPVLASLFRSSMQELGSRRWRQWVALATNIAELGDDKARQRHLKSYLQVQVREATLTAQLVFICMTKDEQRSPYRYRRFRRAFTHLAVGGVVYDHARDLYSDFVNGLTRVSPGRLTARLIYLRGVMEVAKLLAFPRIAHEILGVRLKPAPRQILRYWRDTEGAMRSERSDVLESAAW